MNTNSPAIYPSAMAETPCPGNGYTPIVGDFPTSSAAAGVPSLDEIANYNNMNPTQKLTQKEQLHMTGTQTPWIPQSRTAAQQPTAMPQMSQLAPITPTTQPMPITTESIQYMNGFLRTQIGRPVRVEFLIGTNTLVDRTGILLAVGANYILLNEAETDDIVACDFYNIKFVKFYY